MHKVRELEQLHMRLWDITTDMPPECVEISLDILKRLKTLLLYMKRVDRRPDLPNTQVSKEATI